ncbi:MAG: hypothetical protein IJW24_04060 [Clostridia bacterium]|nr:hypothetical protein [Clostridia bacterium]
MFFSKRQRALDKEISKGAKFYSENEETITINIKSQNHDQIFSEYNYEDKTTLNPNLCDYLWDNAKLAPLDKDLTIKIYDKSNLNSEEVGCAIRTHYRREYVDAKNELKKINIFSLACMLVGIVFLIALAFLHNAFNNYYIDILLEISSWVFIWEAVDRWFLERPSIRRKCIRIQKLYSAKIVIVK